MRSKLKIDLQILRYIDNFAQQIILLTKGFFSFIIMMVILSIWNFNSPFPLWYLKCCNYNNNWSSKKPEKKFLVKKL